MPPLEPRPGRLRADPPRSVRGPGRATRSWERDDGLVYTGDPSDYFTYHSGRRTRSASRGSCGAARRRVEPAGGPRPSGARSRGRRDRRVAARRRCGPTPRRPGRPRLALADVDESLEHSTRSSTSGTTSASPGARRGGAPLLRRLRRRDDRTRTDRQDSVDPTRLDGEHRDAAAYRFRVRFAPTRARGSATRCSPPCKVEALVAGTGWCVARLVDVGTPRYGIVLEKTG